MENRTEYCYERADARRRFCGIGRTILQGLTHVLMRLHFLELKRREWASSAVSEYY
jgi:hypothetical protein